MSLAVKVLLLQGSGLSASAGEEGNVSPNFPFNLRHLKSHKNVSAGYEGPRPQPLSFNWTIYSLSLLTAGIICQLILDSVILLHSLRWIRKCGLKGSQVCNEYSYVLTRFLLSCLFYLLLVYLFNIKLF